MTACANCETTVRESRAKVCVHDGTSLILCLDCQTEYPSNRQYSPTVLPQQSRVPLDGRDST